LSRTSLPSSSATTTSVNVPPMSMPMRAMTQHRVPAGRLQLVRGRHREHRLTAVDRREVERPLARDRAVARRALDTRVHGSRTDLVGDGVADDRDRCAMIAVCGSSWADPYEPNLIGVGIVGICP
jgi:hypothetical protein